MLYLVLNSLRQNLANTQPPTSQITPIRCINGYQQNFSLRVRVVTKDDHITMVNKPEKPNLRLFKCVVTDESACRQDKYILYAKCKLHSTLLTIKECYICCCNILQLVDIRVTFWNEQADKCMNHISLFECIVQLS